jgi:hypothetical protein
VRAAVGLLCGAADSVLLACGAVACAEACGFCCAPLLTPVSSANPTTHTSKKWPA